MTTMDGEIRYDWTIDQIVTLHELPLLELVGRANAVHRQHHDPNKVQKASLLSIKTGGCPENCAYCPQSAHHSEVDLTRDKLMDPVSVIATCLSASVPDAKLFEGGREFAAWLGLVPRQHSTGGKPRLGSISKMGNRRLRKLLVVGAHAALYRMKNGKTQSQLADWARTLLAKKSFKLVAVALANKIARIAWAIMARNIQFQPDFVPDHRAPASV